MLSTTNEALAALQNDSLPENQRKAAAHYLQHHPSPEGINALIENLTDGDPGVRWACSTALAELGEASLKPLLMAIGGTSNDMLLREGALHALAHSSSKDVREKTTQLRAALKGPGAQLSSMEEATKLMLQL